MDIWTELERYREDGHVEAKEALGGLPESCLLYTSPSPRDRG